MNFPHSPHDTAPPDLLITKTNPNGLFSHQTVNTVTTFKYLGVIFDSKLCWNAHFYKIMANAAWWSTQVAHISKISGGMPPCHFRQLYNTVAIPAFTYATDIWYTNIWPSPMSKKCLGSVTVMKKLIPIQRRIAKLITRALNMTASDILDAHANLLSIDLLFKKITF